MLCHLTEAGTDTSGLDLAARPVVNAVIRETVAQMMSRDLPHNHIPEMNHTVFAELLRRHQRAPLDVVGPFCQMMSERLTKLVQAILVTKFGKTMQPVSVEVAPMGKDGVASSLDEVTKTIHIEFGTGRILLPLLSILGREAFGLAVTDGYEILRSQIIGTLVHEYGHLMQNVHRGDLPTSLGIQTPTTIGDAASHLGSSTEIDSFSSQAVAELTQMIDARHINPDDLLDEIRHTLSVGDKTNSQTYNLYMAMLKNTFAQHYPELNPHVISKVWKRFVKNVWLKLNAYYTARIGRADAHRQQFMNKHWLDWAHRLPRSAFIVWLAGQVANDLIANKSRRVSFEQLIDSVADETSGMIQHDAERFIESYFFGYPSFDPQLARMIDIFRRVVKRRIVQSTVRRAA